ncbi:histidine phosphatase family protein [Acinetobacter baumannii]
MLLTHMLGLSLSKYWRIKQEPCCINEIVIDGETFTVHRINDNSHLNDLK